MATKEQQIETLYKELAQSSADYDDEKSLKLCDDLIKLGQDTLALQCKVITLIRLDRYHDALQLIARKFRDSSIDFSFEKLYCYYRTSQWQQAFDLLATVKQTHANDQAVLFLEAQLYYSQDKYQEALDVYGKLIQQVDPQDPIYEEVKANILAAKSGLAQTQPVSMDEPMVNQPSYELSYNMASLLLAQGDYEQAIDFLIAAREQCTERLREQGVSQGEIDEELAIMTTQLAYAYQIQGQVDRAKETYQDIVASKVHNVAVNAVVANNLVSLQGTKDLFDSAKKLKTASAKDADAKLQKYQKRIVRMNDALLQMHMNKHANCKDMVQSLLDQYPDMDDLYVLMAAVTHQQTQKYDTAIAELKAHGERHPTSLAVVFATIQLELLAAQAHQALQTLEAYLEGQPDKQYRAGIVALRVWLYEHTGQADRAMQVLETASNHWQSSSDEHPPTSILKQTAQFKLKTGRFAEATRDFEKLVKADPTDAQALAGLIAAYAETQPDKAKQYSDALPPIVPATALDVDALETVVPGVKKGYVKKSSDKQVAKQVAKKKKRAPLLPKEYDASNQPDPERWLPKQERSDYKPKKGSKKSGSQGVALEGGGIGLTGSARIAGAAPQDIPAEPPMEVQEEKKPAPAKSNQKNKKAAKKKGKNKW
ncbi:hypothetical protein DM01DRAFT_1333615 [Hesseltinella vesiculosa]|uniref:Signal recognition particle subunit SRP72 n=1 Tax=Hesseltinella vesiculosa TaxID=101127 RepID=A0A1X2GQL4_9FUNG|nr:hypothetical protein DM01DRAFT_1333615 [Hesseltinella vesiculosa]